MNQTGSSPKSRLGRVFQDDPPARLEQYRTGRVNLDLTSGDFRLFQADGKTVLMAIAPTPADTQVVRRKEPFVDWTRDEWKDFLGEAEKFRRSDLLEDLESIKKEVIEKRMSQEDPVFDDDVGESPIAVHALHVNYSQDEGYLKVKGPATYEHRQELCSLGLRWVPSLREWAAGYSSELFSSVADYVRNNNRIYDPDQIGYEKCPNCDRWKPEESACPCLE